MELQTLQSLLSDFDKLKEAVEKEKLLYISSLGYASEKGNTVYDLKHLTKFRKQYIPHYHDIMDASVRKDKLITKDDGAIDNVKVARLPIPLQKTIVNRAAAFLCGNPIELSSSPSDKLQESLLEVVKKVWQDNKLDYENKNIAKLMMSETEVAELWYMEDAPDGYWELLTGYVQGMVKRPRMRIIAHSYGDLLYPVFNAAGDMIAFGRAYMMVGEEGSLVQHFDIYTDTRIYFSNNERGKFEMEKDEPNLFGKIPVIYYNQVFPEWHDVQPLIDRFETSVSNHSDTNDYFGSPMVKVKGEVRGFSKKGEQGKVLELGDQAEAEYMTWDQSPASTELEQKNLRSLIFDMTDTPDISIEQMKSIGTFSGIALKMLFLNAHLKAADKEETFGKSVQRRINFLKAAGAKINVQLVKALSLSIKPKFEYYLPKDEKGMVDLLTEAVAGKILSQRTAVSLNPVVEDPETEITQIQEEQAASPMAGIFNQ